MNGRMLDVYRRLHQHEENFFMPHDFEISMAEIKVLVEKSKRWTGPTGTQRKISICEYDLKDPLDSTFEETTTHICIYELHMDGRRQIYRHFIRNPQGAIMEIFGDLTNNFGSQYSALEELLLETPDSAKLQTKSYFDSL